MPPKNNKRRRPPTPTVHEPRYFFRSRTTTQSADNPEDTPTGTAHGEAARPVRAQAAQPSLDNDDALMEDAEADHVEAMVDEVQDVPMEGVQTTITSDGADAPLQDSPMDGAIGPGIPTVPAIQEATASVVPGTQQTAAAAPAQECSGRPMDLAAIQRQVAAERARRQAAITTMTPVPLVPERSSQLPITIDATPQPLSLLTSVPPLIVNSPMPSDSMPSALPAVGDDASVGSASAAPTSAAPPISGPRARAPEPTVALRFIVIFEDDDSDYSSYEDGIEEIFLGATAAPGLEECERDGSSMMPESHVWYFKRHLLDKHPAELYQHALSMGKSLLILEDQPDQLYDLNEDGVSHIYSLDDIVQVQSPIPLPGLVPLDTSAADIYYYEMEIGSMVQHAQSETQLPLNALDHEVEPGSFHLPLTEEITSSRVAWRSTSHLRRSYGGPNGRVPRGTGEAWAMFSVGSTLSDWHVDTKALLTRVRNCGATGVKFWVFRDPDRTQEALRWRIERGEIPSLLDIPGQLAIVPPGATLIMPPDTEHKVRNGRGATMTLGEHFYSASTMRRSLRATLHLAIAENITNSYHQYAILWADRMAVSTASTLKAHPEACTLHWSGWQTEDGRKNADYLRMGQEFLHIPFPLDNLASLCLMIRWHDDLPVRSATNQDKEDWKRAQGDTAYLQQREAAFEACDRIAELVWGSLDAFSDWTKRELKHEMELYLEALSIPDSDLPAAPDDQTSCPDPDRSHGKKRKGVEMRRPTGSKRRRVEGSSMPEHA